MTVGVCVCKWKEMTTVDAESWRDTGASIAAESLHCVSTGSLFFHLRVKGKPFTLIGHVKLPLAVSKCCWYSIDW